MILLNIIIIFARPLTYDPSIVEIILNYLFTLDYNFITQSDLKNININCSIMNHCEIISAEKSQEESIKKILKWYQPIHIDPDEIISSDSVKCKVYKEKEVKTYTHRYFDAIELFVSDI